MERIDHILVVDDDRDIRELIVGYLEKSGYRASGAANGKAMWSVLKNHQIDLIVLDIMLPGDDGLTLCRQLRNDGQQDIPVLMLTARSEDSDRILGLEMGADDYLVKPFVARELLARIKAILRRARALPPIYKSAKPAGLSPLATGCSIPRRGIYWTRVAQLWR